VPIRCVILALLAVFTASAQFRLNPNTATGKRGIETFESILKSASTRPRLNCRVSPVQPRFTFDTRLYTGYRGDVSLSELTSPDPNSIASVFRVTPLKPAGPPEYFFEKWDVPQIDINRPDFKDLAFALDGGVFVGNGRFRVDWVLVDQRERTCAKSWEVSANSGGTDPLLPPGAVAEVFLDNWPGLTAKADDRRVTILLHATPTFRRRVTAKLNGYDRMILLGSLRTILDRSSFSHARVIVFDLERRRVLFEDEEFTPNEFSRLNATLAKADYATIPFQTLASGPSEREFLLSLIGRSTSTPRTPDAIFFVGPARYNGAEKRTVQELDWSKQPPLSYFAISPYALGPDDAIRALVKDSRGRNFTIHRPEDMAKAIGKFENSGS
jgi:hypothetical protein